MALVPSFCDRLFELTRFRVAQPSMDGMGWDVWEALSSIAPQSNVYRNDAFFSFFKTSLAKQTNCCPLSDAAIQSSKKVTRMIVGKGKDGARKEMETKGTLSDCTTLFI